jgi:hypothetical protein
MDERVRLMRLVCCIHGMRIHLKTGGQMRLTRTATPATLRAIATEFTGKQYPRSKKGMEAALADLEEMKKTLTAT